MHRTISTALGSMTKRREKAMVAIQNEIDRLIRKREIMRNRADSATKAIDNYNRAIVSFDSEISELENLKAKM